MLFKVFFSILNSSVYQHRDYLFQTIFSFYGRNTRLDHKNFMDAFIQFGLYIEGIGNPFSMRKDSIALTEQISKSPFVPSYGTIKMTTK